MGMFFFPCWWDEIRVMRMGMEWNQMNILVRRYRMVVPFCRCWNIIRLKYYVDL